MIVKLQVLQDDLRPDGGRDRDNLILAVDRALGGAIWEAAGEDTWKVSK